MTRYVALLQGINLGARRRIAMADLRALLGELGYTDVSTFLQSGNALLTAPATTEDELSRTLEESITARFGFSVPCLVRDERELTRVIESNPLAGIATDPKRYQVTFLSGRPDPGAFEDVDPRDYEPEAFALGEREIFAWHPAGVRDSRLAKVFTGGRLGELTATARNWNTVTRLHRLICG